MSHNLFTHPTEFSVVFNEEDNDYEVENLLEAQTILDVLDDLDYDTKEIERYLKQRLDDSNEISEEAKKEVLGQLYVMLSENGYLRTVFKAQGEKS